MNFKPILFNSDMVLALLEGKKTQTRRIIKDEILQENKYPNDEEFVKLTVKPKYFVGDILWVRETVYIDTNGIDKSCNWDTVTYRADHFHRDIRRKGEDYDKAALLEMCDEGWYDPDYPDKSDLKWQPSIFMPKEACRIFLKITSIRVERLKDISEQDAIKEGIEIIQKTDYPTPFYRRYKGCEFFPGKETDSAQYSFQTLWQTINGNQSWHLNPWVWRIEFERIQTPKQWP